MDSLAMVDRELVKEALAVSDFETEKEVVEVALKSFITNRTHTLKYLLPLVENGRSVLDDDYCVRKARGKID